MNMSYVLTSSADFKHTLDGIVKGLNNAGFTDQDYRAQEEVPAPAPMPVAQQTTFSITPPAPAEEPQDIFDDPDTVRLDPVCVNSTTEPQKIAPAVQDILAQAGKEIVAFEAALQQHKDDPASDLPQEAQKMVGQTKVKAEFADEIEQLVLPKFCLKIPQSILMPSNTQELTKENLLSNFTLKGKPSNIDFDHLDNNLAQVDLDGDGTPRASKMESQYQQFIGQQFPLMPGENRLKLCRNIIHTTLSRQKKLNAVDDTELQRYVDYIIDGMNQDQLENAESREKIKLGRAWQNAAGSQYRYYMVFQNKDLHLDGAYRFDEFLKILGEL